MVDNKTLAALKSLLNNGGGGGGGASVQSDWNQTDDTAADFIKNKPFGDFPAVILEEQELPYNEDEGGCVGLLDNPINAGDVLTVKYDGTEYVCEAAELNGWVAFGNFGLMGQEDTGEPFIAMVAGETVMFMPLDGASHMIGISAEIVQKLDDKYVANQAVFYVDSGFLYKEIICATRVTKEELLQAVKKMPVVLSVAGINFIYPLYFFGNENYAEVLYNNGLDIGRVYTAEYTPET